MSYKKGVITTLGIFTPQLKKGSKQGQLIKNGETKNKNQQLKDLENADFLRSAVVQLEIGPAYGRRENATKSLVKGMQNSENAREINFLMVIFFCRT